MPKYPGISPYDNEKGTLGTAKKRWEKLYVKEIESDTVSGIEAQIDYLATTAENSVANAVAAKNAAVDAKAAAENAAETAATAAAGIQSVVETDVDNTLSIAGVAADAKVTGDWLRDIAKPVTLNTSLPETAYADEYMKVTTDSEGRVLYGVKRDGTFTWQKGVPKHLQDKINELAAPTIDNDEYMYVMLDSEGHVLFGVKKDGSFDWQKGVPKPVKEKLEEVAQTVIQSEEFVQLTQDSDGKLIEGVRDDGSKVFFSPVRFAGGVKWSSSDIEGINDGLKESNNSQFNYLNYTKNVFIDYQNILLHSGLDVLYLNGNTEGMTKENRVNLTWVFRNRSGSCTCKWQGNSTVFFPKKNYTIAKINPSIDVGWGQRNKYVLKADYSDYSHARNILAAKLWGGVVKTRQPANQRLANLPNGGAIDGFPIMLVINDEYQGIYNFNISKDENMLGMGNSETDAMIQAEAASETTRFRATVSKEDILANKYWGIEYVPDEDNPDWAIDSLNNMITAVINSTGANYRQTLQDYLDIESAIDYYIFITLIGHHDGIAHNFIMCTYDGVKWFFNAYDMDMTFGSNLWGERYVSPRYVSFSGTQGLNRVFHLIYTYDKASLIARYQELRNTVLSEVNIANTLTEFLKLIPKALFDEEVRLWPNIASTSVNNFEQIVNWYRLRVQYLDSEVEKM